MVLLIVAGLMINSYARLTGMDVGLNPDNVLSMEVNLAGMDRGGPARLRYRHRRHPL